MTEFPWHEANGMNVAYTGPVDGKHIDMCSVPIGIQIYLRVEELPN